MKAVLQSAVLLAITLVFAGCTSFNNVPYNAAGAEKLHRIGLLTVGTPPGLTVAVRTPTGASFGLIGGLIAEGEIDKKSAAFSSAAEHLGYSVRKQLTTALKSDLEAEGYQVNLITANGARGDLVDNYPAGGLDDALLDVVVRPHTVGYRSAGSETKYYPYVFVTARLVSADGSDVLYSEQLVYNPIDPPKNERTIPPTGNYSYQDFDHLMADPKEAVAGVKAAVEAIAAAIASDLQRH